MTTRRQFIKSAVAAGVVASLPSPMADATSLPFTHDGVDQSIKFVRSVGMTWDHNPEYSIVIDAAGQTIAEVYEFTKFHTRRRDLS